MRVFVMAVVGLMAVAGAQAQQNTQQALKDTQALLVERECHGALRANQKATGGAAVWTISAEDENKNAGNVANAALVKPTGLGIHVEFADAKTTVKAIEIRVSYLPVGLRTLEVKPRLNTVAQPPAEHQKTFHLEGDGATRIGGDLLVGSAATITRVHLVSVTYVDGSVWRPASEDVCSVAPSLYMPVEAMK